MTKYRVRYDGPFIRKFERCVRKVKAKVKRSRKKYNPQAVCTVSLKGRPPRRPRS